MEEFLQALISIGASFNEDVNSYVVQKIDLWFSVATMDKTNFLFLW